MRIVVVGGGIAGLSAAFYLQEAGADVTLLEGSPHLGGAVQTERVSGLIIEKGPDSLLARKPHARELAGRLGLAGEVVGPGAARGTSVLWRGRLLPLPEGFLGLDTPLLSPLGKARAALDLLLPPRRDSSDESLSAFFGRRMGREVAERMAAPLFSGIHAADPDQLSLLAAFPLFRAMEQKYGSLIRALRKAPLGSGPMFITLRGGLGRLVTALQSRLRRTFVSTRVVRAAAGRLFLAGGESLQADSVIWAVPPHAAARALEGLAPDAACELAAIPAASTAVVALAYPATHPLSGTGFLVARGEDTVITGCTFVSNKWPHTTPPGLQLLRCFVGRAGEEEALRLPDGELLAAVQHDLRQILGLPASPVLTRVYRWPRAMPQMNVGHLERLARAEAALPPGHFLAGAGYRGTGVPDAIAQGAAAAEKALAKRASPAYALR